MSGRKAKEEPSTPKALDKVKEEPGGKASTNGVKSAGKTSVKTNGTSVVNKKTPDKANGSKIVKKEVADVKKEASTNGVSKGIVKRTASAKEASTSGVSKAIVKKTTSSVSTSKVVTKKSTTGEKEKKKSFDLPGQKHEPPEERDPLRIFYGSLYEQRPDSEMAEIWMMEHGLLPLEDAKKAFAKKPKRGSNGFGTPVKQSQSSSRVVARTSTSNGKPSTSKAAEQKGKRKIYDSDDDDLVIARPLKRKSR